MMQPFRGPFHASARRRAAYDSMMDEPDDRRGLSADLPSENADGPSGAEDAAPARPSESVRTEIIAFLKEDQSALGDVWRRTQDGETPADIQAARGTVR